MSLTFKAHGGHDAPWFVVPDPQGTDLSDPASAARWQRGYLIEAFGLGDVADIQSKTLHQLALICEPLWSGTTTVATLLGGTPVNDTTTVGGSLSGKAKASPTPARDVQVQQEATPAPQAASQPTPAPEAPPASEEPTHAHQGVLDEIAGSETKADLKKVFAANKELFQNEPSVLEAGKARMKELKS